MATASLAPSPTRARADDTPLSLPQVRPDLAHLARPLFLRLTEALVGVGELLAACRKMRDKSTRHERAWGVPELFFADAIAQRECPAKKTAQAFPEPFVSLLAGSYPKQAGDWQRLPDLLGDAMALLEDSSDVRRMARAVPGIGEAARAVPQAGELAAVLAMPEEEVWLVIHPAARAGFRMVVDGVADVAQLHVLLADALTGDPSRGYLSGRRPKPEVLGACRDTVRSDGVVASSRFQFYRPEALRPDGALPEGFAGSDHWYWGPEPLGAVPQEGGERLLLIGDPVLPTTWEVTRRFSRIAARTSVLEVMAKAEVEGWLRTRCPALPVINRRAVRVA